MSTPYQLDQMNMDDAFDAQNMAEADAEMDIALNQYDYGEHWKITF